MDAKFKIVNSLLNKNYNVKNAHKIIIYLVINIVDQVIVINFLISNGNVEIVQDDSAYSMENVEQKDVNILKDQTRVDVSFVKININLIKEIVYL